VSPQARTAVRWLAWIGGIALVVVLATGAYVTFRYRPDANGTTRAMVRIHKWSSYTLGFAALCTMLVLVPRRALRVVVPIAFFVVLWSLCGRWGTKLAWDQVALAAVTTGRGVEGIFVRHDAVKFVLVDGHEYSWEHFRTFFWLHAVVFPLAIAATFVWAILWSRRIRRRQPDMKSSAETPAAIRR
jgi:hypothetical protein